ncbi:MAG TPA: hypothetical protein VK548_13755, partial [Candidatus Acidoferrum sp.]|nr:hypothetical protein [Candidatus Acidoferrum sp.]
MNSLQTVAAALTVRLRAAYPLRVMAPQAALEMDAPTAAALLVDFLRRETRKAGFKRAVLGLSGGVDSAVA